VFFSHLHCATPDSFCRPGTTSVSSSPSSTFELVRFDPGGITACSRWLSEATPPVRQEYIFDPGRGRRRDESVDASGPPCDPCRGRGSWNFIPRVRETRPRATSCGPCRGQARFVSPARCYAHGFARKSLDQGTRRSPLYLVGLLAIISRSNEREKLIKFTDVFQVWYGMFNQCRRDESIEVSYKPLFGTTGIPFLT